MKKNSTLVFVFTIIAIILGVTLFKQFDFQNLKFEKPALAVVYGITFIISIAFLLKNYKKK